MSNNPTTPAPQMSDPEYARGYMIRLAAVNAITTIIGVIIAVMPFALGWYPGGFDTTVHITLGALIAVLGFFRAALGYGSVSVWVDIVLIPLGFFVTRLPHWMHHEGWDSAYTNGHIAAGAIVIIIAIISALMTKVEMRNTDR